MSRVRIPFALLSTLGALLVPACDGETSNPCAAVDCSGRGDRMTDGGQACCACPGDHHPVRCVRGGL